MSTGASSRSRSASASRRSPSPAPLGRGRASHRLSRRPAPAEQSPSPTSSRHAVERILLEGRARFGGVACVGRHRRTLTLVPVSRAPPRAPACTGAPILAAISHVGRSTSATSSRCSPVCVGRRVGGRSLDAGGPGGAHIRRNGSEDRRADAPRPTHHRTRRKRHAGHRARGRRARRGGARASCSH